MDIRTELSIKSNPLEMGFEGERFVQEGGLFDFLTHSVYYFCD